VKYWGFISYSHKDTAIADWLHQKLETYRVPKSLVGTPSREGKVPSRIMPIFRDREELPTSSELGDNLQKSLQQSRYLIVICSPDAAQSRWVEEEVSAFKGWHGRERVIALIASGIPNASDRSEPASECFPHSLRFDVDAAGSPSVRVEPIAADLRAGGDGRQRAFLKIVAGLLGVGFDDLYQREKRREHRRRILGGAIVAVGLLVVAATGWSIARLGKSQKEMRHDLASVRQEAGVMSTDYKDVRPSNNESEVRIRAAAERAQQALDSVEGHTDMPSHEYALAIHAARDAVAAVAKEARTAQETIFATELAKPLEARLLKVNNEYGNEIIRRTEASVPASALQKMRNPERPK
jgi:hypothetical protein